MRWGLEMIKFILDAVEANALREILQSHLNMAGFCEMADEDKFEQKKYEVCKKIIKKITG
jgi:hypothetical protein